MIRLTTEAVPISEAINPRSSKLLCPEMVICVQGGLIQAIYSDRADVPVTVIDWDVAPGDIEDEFIPVVRATHQGRPIHAYVDQPESLPLKLLAGTDLEAIVEAAEVLDGP